MLKRSRKLKMQSNNSGATLVCKDGCWWSVPDVLRGSMVVAEHRRAILSTIFLESFSDVLEELHGELEIECGYSSLSGALPKNYAQSGLNKQHLRQIIDLIGNIRAVTPSYTPKVSWAMSMSISRLICQCRGKKRKMGILRRTCTGRLASPTVRNANYTWIQYIVYHFTLIGCLVSVVTEGADDQKQDQEVEKKVCWLQSSSQWLLS